MCWNILTLGNPAPIRAKYLGKVATHLFLLHPFYASRFIRQEQQDLIAFLEHFLQNPACKPDKKCLRMIKRKISGVRHQNEIHNSFLFFSAISLPAVAQIRCDTTIKELPAALNKNRQFSKHRLVDLSLHLFRQ
jgi:hypothetical protein